MCRREVQISECNGAPSLIFIRSLCSPPAQHRCPWSSRPTSRCTWGSRPVTQQTKGRTNMQQTNVLRQTFLGLFCGCTVSTIHRDQKPPRTHYQPNSIVFIKYPPAELEPETYHDKQHRNSDRPNLYNREASACPHLSKTCNRKCVIVPHVSLGNPDGPKLLQLNVPRPPPKRSVSGTYLGLFMRRNRDLKSGPEVVVRYRRVLTVPLAISNRTPEPPPPP